MAAKLKGNPSKSLFGDDDFLDLFDDEKPKTVRGKATRGGPLSRSSATDNIFSMLAEEVKRDGGDNEDSDVSAADPDDILKNMKDMDDMDADLFTSKKKPGTAPAQMKQRGNEGPKRDSSTLETNGNPQGAAGEPIAGGKKPNSAPATTAQNNRKFTLSDSGGDDGEVLAQRLPTKDVDDPLADLLDDLLPDETKPQSKSSTQPAKTDQKPAPSPTASPFKAANKRGNLTFDDDKDDLMDALGLKSDESQNRRNVLWSNKERSEPPQRARTKLDEILEKKERKEQPQQPREKASAVKEPLVEDDLTFGSYQPTLVSTPEGRQSRRQSVRFSTEDVSASTPEKKAKAITPAMPAPLRHRNSADWLGLKTDEDQGFLEDHAKDTKASTDSPKAPSSPALERRSSVSRATSGAKLTTEIPALIDNLPKQSTAEVTKSLKREEEEDDWFAALSRKKAMSDSLGLREEVDLDSPVSKQVPSQAHAVKEDMVPSVKETSDTFIGQPSPTAHSTPVRERRTKQDNPAQASDPSSAASVSQPQLFPSDKGSRVPHHEPSRAPEETLQQLPSCLLPTATPPGSLWAVPLQNQIPNTPAAVQQQVTFSSDTLQQLLLQQQVMQSHLLGGVMDAGVLHRLKEREQPSGDHHALQSRIIQLEGQVQALQLEREKSQLLLENQQQLHKKDLELMENAYKARVKMLEESSAQRETQARQENEDLMERLSTAMRSAEQERSEMLAHNQRKLTQAQQDRDREVDRLRDLQRKSILEMKKDHEHQVQRLKKLKDEEIDAVTSATSQTRSLTVVMEQMEQFSSRLGEISSRVESTHEHTAHGLEQGARHRDEQHRLMQERVAQQQKAMVEERAYLKEIISRMDTQLNEQQRQLEKERWKMTAEQAKAESTQRGLEDERRALNLQINMEREELERAKSALLEEQKCVMQHCAEERRKLAAELAHFHALEKQRHERAERDASSLLEKREGSIISLAQEQADLKLHTAELKRKEMAAAQERETLGRQREELDREKERISSTALRLQTRAQEVEAFSRLAAEKYEEGERALQEAKHVEAEHEARLRKIHTQTERLRQQEQLMLQQRMGLSHLQKETEELRLDPPITFDPQIIQPILPGSGLPNPQLPLSLSIPHSTSFANSQAMALQASLALWKYTADKDREYLQEEQIFLDNLKRKSSRSTFNTD